MRTFVKVALIAMLFGLFMALMCNASVLGRM